MIELNRCGDTNPPTLTFTTSKIHSDLRQLRKKIGGFEAKKVANGPQYPVKNFSELHIKLREAADELDMVLAGAIIHQHAIPEPCERGTKCVIVTTVRFMSSDGSYMDFTGTGGGMAPDDKAAGKASTYGAKVAIYMALCLPNKDIPDTDDDELRQEVHDLVDDLKSCTSLKEVKDLKTRLSRLTDYEREYVTPVYIKMTAKFAPKKEEE